MARGIFIANRIREVYLNGKFIAFTNFRELLEDIDVDFANRKFQNLNTIALLTFHVNYYLEGLNRVLEGGPLDMQDKFSFEMPAIQNEAEWKQMVENLMANAERVAKHIEQFPDSKFDEIFVDRKYGTWERNIESVIEHGYYHMGQISLIKKLLVNL